MKLINSLFALFALAAGYNLRPRNGQVRYQEDALEVDDHGNPILRDYDSAFAPGATTGEEHDPNWVPTMDDVEQLIYDQQVSAEESEDFEASEEIQAPDSRDWEPAAGDIFIHVRD
ncbi:Oidioi.mRNA.OKI2018_I69.chr1.g3690.t1.cds [Oikopleura dioica]|uniref:Oidioi.mRNA.OKI2018_I69.chr1.g3690.t1.cds n=1 Tax=Oikopleura dioica TaxID=34765 RepID=A0ABN7T1H1_OIKDI|nr:Oidioi.mRNA.OKI2018_I69.chr1.g3690.t1.cds [Oikopleura dioica]